MTENVRNSTDGSADTRILEARTIIRDSAASTEGSASARLARRLPAGFEVEGRHRYVIQKPLGSGAFGSVYQADCIPAESGTPGASALPDHVAVKFFHPPEGVEPSNLLRRELSALLALRHDRIPRVYDWAIGPREAFVVIDCYPDGSLADLLARRGMLDTETVWRLLADLLQALTAAHRASLLHLDVKPGNVLVDNGGGFVLSDFGISQGMLVSRAIVPPGLGAPAFRAPEQRRGDGDCMDARTDLWGVGVTAWMATTGMPIGRLLGVISEMEPDALYGLPPLRKFRPDCPPKLVNMIMSLVMNRMSDRPGSAAEALSMVQWGGISQMVAEEPAIPRPDAGEIHSIAGSLLDPLWRSICQRPDYQRFFMRFDDGQLLCREGEKSFCTYILLSGKVTIERQGHLLGTEEREGAFIGEVTTLTGRQRTATVRASGPVWTCVFNGAELEQMLSTYPAVAIRLVKTLADRVCRESSREMTGTPAVPDPAQPPGS